MRIKNYIYNIFRLLPVFIAAIFAGCDDMESVLPELSVVDADLEGALYVLCDGNYSLNNSTLALYDFTNGTLDADFFQTSNGRKLGDTGNEIQRYGSKIYVVVNVSSQIEVIDARTGLSIRQIPMFDGSKARQPRYMAFWEDKAYVCSFDGTVARIDTTSLEVEAFVKVGRNPDGITVSNNKLYVSNSGGLDYATTIGYDNTVSVIGIDDFTEIKKIEVGCNPYRILSDDIGYVYVACRGDYNNQKPVFQRINSMNDQIEETWDINVMNFDIYNGNAYLYYYDSETKESWIKVFNLKNHELSGESFIKDGTRIVTPYGIDVDQENGDVYITDAGNYITSGSVYCFRADGTLRFKIKQVGISPNSVVRVDDFTGSSATPGETHKNDSSYIEKVLDYSPAPGQFVGTYPAYENNYSREDMIAMAESSLKRKTGGMVTLGRYGGSLTFSFRLPVLNNPNSKDFRIFGNAFTNSSEPGIVEVSVDVNSNGIADDPWYEIAGSEYSKEATVHGYRICYYRPQNLADSVFFRDNQGGSGRVNAFYPTWQGDSIVCEGTLLAPTATLNQSTGFWTLNSLDWGYADNKPNSSELCQFDLDWAVDKDGKSIKLLYADFIRIYTGVNQNAGWVGELSTEITGAENLSQ